VDGSEELLLRRELPLAWVVVDRPQSRNAMTRAAWRALAATVQDLSADEEVRVIIVRGAGDEAFISGADISEFPAMRADAAMTAEYDRDTAAAWRALAGAPQPVIAMINGLCYGGGCSVALACDLRFAADHARFAIPAARLGLSYPFEAIERLVHAVGPTSAADVLLSTRALDADEALRVGLINRVEPRAELETWTRHYALRLAENAPLTLSAHKIAIQQSLRPPGDRDAGAARVAMARCFNSADYREGVAAFLEKRKPRFTGR
jgi:enoyl-CoA hydratase